MNATPARRDGHLYFLDLLRIVAFVTVLIGHKFQGSLQAAADNPAYASWFRAVVRALLPFSEGGAFGVMLFFLVSGYIITQVVQQERTAVFVVKRLLRIYPLYVFACLLEMAVQASQGSLQTLGWDVRVAQWLLMGDWVGAPYTLGAVEWTLRVELIFYAFMAVAARVGVLRNTSVAIAVYVGVAAVLFWAPPWPRHAGWSDGYFNLYFPMLLIGSAIRLAQSAPRVVQVWAVAAIALILALSLWHTAQIQPRWQHHHFLQLALAVFVLSWLARQRIRLAALGLLLSDLSYAVYLLHNWLWDVLKQPAQAITSWPLLVNVLILAQLFGVCYLAMRWVEKPGIRLGKWICARWLPAPSARVATCGSA